VAGVTLLTRAKGLIASPPIDGDFRETGIWVKLKGNWELALYQGTPVASEKGCCSTDSLSCVKTLAIAPRRRDRKFEAHTTARADSLGSGTGIENYLSTCGMP